MKTTHWVGVRRYLKRTSLLLFLIILICVWFVMKASRELMVTRNALYLDEQRLVQVSKTLEDKKGKIDALESTISRQDKQIKTINSRVAEWRQKLFNLELARDITAYLQKLDPEKQIQRGSFNSIYLTIFYAQKYEKIYQKRYPSFAPFFSWKACVNMGWVESKLDPFCWSDEASARGMFQILEYEKYRLDNGKLNPNKVKNLYPMLCQLGYKKITYRATIEFYLNNPEVQVDCYYHVFYQKLRDVGGDFTAAVVAYHGRVADPENTKYWRAYTGAKNKMTIWCQDVETKIRQ